MALIGQGARPVGIDYSSVGESAWDLSRSNSSAISSAVGAVGDAVKDRREKKDKVKTGIKIADAMSTLYPNLAEPLAPIIESLKNDELRLSEQAALADQLDMMINAGMQQSRDNALMAMDERRVRVAERGLDVEADRYTQQSQSAVAAAMSENDIAAQEALSRYTAIKDMEAPIIGQLPKMDKSEDLITKYLDEGEGTKALNAVEAYETARMKQMEPLLGAPGMKLTKIGGTDAAGMPIDIDAFVTPSGDLLDINRQPLNAPQGPATQGGLPATPDGATDALLPSLDRTRRTVPMPTIGIRPSGTPTPRTPTQQALDETRLKLAEQEVKTAESTVAKEQSTKQASLANAQDAVALIDRLQTHPGFEAAVGTSLTPGFVPATDRKGAEAIIEQLKGQAFLNAIQQLRGLGALSDAEGAKLQQAAARLNADQSEADFKQALNEYKGIVQQGIERLSKQSGGQPAAPAQSAADRLRALKR